MSSPAIQIENLSKSYRINPLASHLSYRTLREDLVNLFKNGQPKETLWALKDISLTIQKGEMVGIIGRNGAGKTTLLKILARITPPSKGLAVIKGRVGSLLEVGTGFHPELTGRENIYLNGVILGMKRSEVVKKFDEIVAFAEVESFLDTPIKHYSSGMQVRLAFAIAAHLDPEILFVDEVLAVGDFSFQKKCLGTMEKITKQGRTILFVSHQMEAILNLCPRSILLEKGKIEKDGPSQKVVESYLQSARQLNDGSLRYRRDRQGVGHFRFVETWVENKQGHRVTAVLSGDPLVLVGEFEVAEGKSVSDVEVAFAVYSANGTQLTDLCNLFTGDFFEGKVPKRGRVRCIIPRLPCNTGLYTYNMFAASKQVLQDFLLNVGSFEVESGDYFGTGKTIAKGQGHFLVNHRWQLEAIG